jgi:hypothetical protein
VSVLCQLLLSRGRRPTGSRGVLRNYDVRRVLPQFLSRWHAISSVRARLKRESCLWGVARGSGSVSHTRERVVEAVACYKDGSATRKALVGVFAAVQDYFEP